MLHRRAGACGRQGPAGLPPGIDEKAPEEPGRAERGGRQGRLEQARTRRRTPRPGGIQILRQLHRRLRRGERR